MVTFQRSLFGNYNVTRLWIQKTVKLIKIVKLEEMSLVF